MTAAEALLQALLAALALVWSFTSDGTATSTDGARACVRPSPCQTVSPDLPDLLGPEVTPEMVALDESLIVCPAWKVCP